MMQKLKTVLSRPRVRAGVAATVAVAAVAAAAMVGVHVGRGEGREQAQADGSHGHVDDAADAALNITMGGSGEEFGVLVHGERSEP